MFQRCREVDPSGPLATLRKLLLSNESIASFKQWVLRHWYAVLLILVAVIALLVSTFNFTCVFVVLNRTKSVAVFISPYLKLSKTLGLKFDLELLYLYFFTVLTKNSGVVHFFHLIFFISLQKCCSILDAVADYDK